MKAVLANWREEMIITVNETCRDKAKAMPNEDIEIAYRFNLNLSLEYLRDSIETDNDLMVSIFAGWALDHAEVAIIWKKLLRERSTQNECTAQ